MITIYMGVRVRVRVRVRFSHRSMLSSSLNEGITTTIVITKVDKVCVQFNRASGLE